MATNSEPLLPLPPKTKLRRYLFLLIVLGLSLYFLLPQFARIEYALQVASSLSIPFVALSLGAQVLSYLGSGYLLKAVVRLASKPVSVVQGALITAGANSVGTLGGGVLGTTGMTYLWLRQRGVSQGAAGLGGWIPIFLNDATLAIISLIGLLTLILLNKFSSILILGFALAVLILASGLGVLVWSLTHREKLMPLVMAIADFIAKFRRKPIDRQASGIAVGRLLEAWDTLLKGGWKGPATGAALNAGFDLLTLAFLFLSAGHGLSLPVLIAGYGVPQLLGKLTVILGGVGVVETTMVGLYGALGVPTPVSVVVVLVYRLISFWMPTLAGIGLIPYLEHRKNTAPANG
jgi:glycosyltransferase 2 family protein